MGRAERRAGKLSVDNGRGSVLPLDPVADQMVGELVRLLNAVAGIVVGLETEAAEFLELPT